MKITVVKGFFGTATPTAGIYISLLPQVEAWLRITSLVVGILVGLLTCLSLLNKWKGK